jgi:hypothetical protein
MPPRKYKTDAERQAAYRQRHAQAKELSLDELRQGIKRLIEELEQRMVERHMNIKTRGWTPDLLNKIELLKIIQWVHEQLKLLDQ